MLKARSKTNDPLRFSVPYFDISIKLLIQKPTEGPIYEGGTFIVVIILPQPANYKQKNKITAFGGRTFGNQTLSGGNIIRTKKKEAFH